MPRGAGPRCPLVQRLGHLPLEQVIGVRIPGGQPSLNLYSCGYSEVPHVRPCLSLPLCPHSARLGTLGHEFHSAKNPAAISGDCGVLSVRLCSDCPLIRSSVQSPAEKWEICAALSSTSSPAVTSGCRTVTGMAGFFPYPLWFQ